MKKSITFLFVLFLIITKAQITEPEAVPMILTQISQSTELPMAVDNSEKKYWTNIIHQEGNSCAQVSAIEYMFTYEINRITNHELQTPNIKYQASNIKYQKICQ